jgi:hypothetical protein
MSTTVSLGDVPAAKGQPEAVPQDAIKLTFQGKKFDKNQCIKLMYAIIGAFVGEYTIKNTLQIELVDASTIVVYLHWKPTTAQLKQLNDLVAFFGR